MCTQCPFPSEVMLRVGNLNSAPLTETLVLGFWKILGELLSVQSILFQLSYNTISSPAFKCVKWPKACHEAPNGLL